jgi:hypothetical protein
MATEMVEIEIELRTPLDVLAGRIKREHEACLGTMRKGFDHAMEAGRLLIEAKGKVQHGEWTDFVQKCGMSARTAQGYAQLAREWPRLEKKYPRPVAHLGLRDALALIAEPKEEPEQPATVLSVRPLDTPTVRKLDDEFLAKSALEPPPVKPTSRNLEAVRVVKALPEADSQSDESHIRAMLDMALGVLPVQIERIEVNAKGLTPKRIEILTAYWKRLGAVIGDTTATRAATTTWLRRRR